MFAQERLMTSRMTMLRPFVNSIATRRTLARYVQRWEKMLLHF